MICEKSDHLDLELVHVSSDTYSNIVVPGSRPRNFHSTISFAPGMTSSKDEASSVQMPIFEEHGKSSRLMLLRRIKASFVSVFDALIECCAALFDLTISLTLFEILTIANFCMNTFIVFVFLSGGRLPNFNVRQN